MIISSDGYNKQKMKNIVTLSDIYTYNNLAQYDFYH